MMSIARGLAAAVIVAMLAGMGCVQPAHGQAPPVPGSGNVATADPPIPRPHTKPCIVVLIPRQGFGRHGNGARMDAAPHRFAYQPPAACKGPWAKVVLEADFAVDAGEQYDRTASIWLDGVNLYFGTTQEPSPGVAPSRHVQRDLTDYSSLLRKPGTGEVAINNWLDAVRGSVIHASARLLFYPANAAFPAPRVPDRIFALNAKDSMPAKLDGRGAQMSRDIAFPRNTTRVYLDLIAEPQAHDEFYYMCLPDKVLRQAGTPRAHGSIDRPRTCGGGSFREVEILIDGKPAGLAPVAPWIYTGGLDPFLWQPIPGAETLNFIPYRVDLTPFAGLLADGKPHRVAVTVLGKPHFFSIAAALLVYVDPHARHTGGAVTRNTLQVATLEPVVTSTLAAGARGMLGDVHTHARQHYVIAGYVDTPRGRVRSRVEATIGFDNLQQFAGTGPRGRGHVVTQTARAETTRTTAGAVARARSLHTVNDYALRVHTLLGPDRGKQRGRAVSVRQHFDRHLVQREPGLPTYQASMHDTHVGADHLSYTQGDRTSFRSRGQSNTQTFSFTDSLGDCYRAQVAARDRKVVNRTQGQGCLQPGTIHWFVHPDGAPASFGWRGKQPAQDHK